MRKNKVEQKELDAYLDEAKSWETSKVQKAERSKRNAWIVAGVSAAVAMSAVLAVSVIGLRMLKPVDPPVLRVDASTGRVDVLKPLANGKTNYKEAINKYFVQKYVRYREGYSRQLAEYYYRAVGLMSGGLVQQQYFKWFNPKNPRSPLNVYGNTAQVEISIQGTSFIKPDVALVRYVRKVIRGTDAPQISHWAATVAFHYTKRPMTPRDREINPLGFVVTQYRDDPDSMAVTTAPTPTTPKTDDKAAQGHKGPVLFASPPMKPKQSNDAAPAPEQPAPTDGQQQGE